ncbi:MAG: hypothetical protein QG622_160 [Actinomycetota bacterium]|nr:hypothetical protein [Actinomycetota bacterium]
MKPVAPLTDTLASPLGLTHVDGPADLADPADLAGLVDVADPADLVALADPAGPADPVEPPPLPPMSVPRPRRRPASSVSRAPAKRPRRYRLRARHARERGRMRVPVALSVVVEVEVGDDRLVLQTLRAHAVSDLDPAQVSAITGLMPSVAAPCLDRLVRLGMVRRHVVSGRERYGLL